MGISKASSRIRYFSFPLILIFCTSGAFAQTGQWGPGESAKPAYSVVYTGRMFGYFRYPDVQRSDQTGCPNEETTPLPAAVEQYRRTLRQTQGRAGMPEVLVSMGDDFAPELLARDMRDEGPAAPHPGELVRKDLFTADPKGEGWWLDEPPPGGTLRIMPEDKGTVPSDNVGCFLRLMGFNAVVPGEQDFYFGPERLRQLGRFLAGPATGHYSPVQMLAANLSIITTLHSPTVPLPLGALPEKIERALRPSGAVTIHLPSNVMPWLQKVQVESGGLPLRVYDCIASRDDPKQFQLPDESPNDCVLLQEEEPDTFRFARPARPSANFIAQYYTLDPGANHALCVEYQSQGMAETHCQVFSVHYPFFQYRPRTSGTTPAPYFLSQEETGTGVAVFGVMDPSLSGRVGQLDDAWRNENRRFDSTIEITDPLEALRQVLGLCTADPHCKGRRKVLLAQMPYYKAAALASKLSVFDMVITQPEAEHANGDEYSSRTTMAMAGATAGQRAYLLTPGVTFDANRKVALSTNLRRADFYSQEHAGGEQKEFLANQVFDASIPAPVNSDDCRSCPFTAAVAKATGQEGERPANGYETLALVAMQQYCGSDVALLQDRDVFTGFEKSVALWLRNENYTAQEFLDEVLWKGDFTFCLPVKGSTLKKVLEESAAFEKQDRDDLSLAVEKGRDLSTLGIEVDPASGVPLVRGQPVNDNKLYGVAMTDYLAFGNTGYPELASEALPPPVRATSMKSLVRLTGLACGQLPLHVTNGSCQAEEIAAADYFDALRQRPFDTTHGLTAWAQLQYWATHPLQPQPVGGTLFAKRNPSPETKVENRAMWWFTLQNVSLEYDLAFIGGSDKTAPGNFSGINSFSQLSTAESSQLGLWTRARGGYSFARYVDFYASGEMKYARSAIRTSANNGNFGPYQLTLNSNLVRGEVGVLSKPFTSRVPIRALVSENLFTQATEPFEQISVPVACGAATCTGGATSLTSFGLGKNFLVMSRIGGRLQNTQGWFEAGREYGENIGTPVGYALHDVGSAIPFSCALAGNRSLSECVAGDPAFTTRSRILPDLRNQYVAGWFMNFHAVAPLYRTKIQLAVDSYGEVFDRERDDTGFNTRYYEDFTLALKVPLWGNLLFAPQVETFYYQNKVVPGQPVGTNHYVFVTSSVKLEYGFDWHRGVGIVRALRYPNGVDTSAGSVAPVP